MPHSQVEARSGRLRAATADLESDKSTIHQPDPATVRFHRKRMRLWPTDYLLEELAVLDAAEDMAPFDDGDYTADVVRNSEIEFASQRQAINDILEYQELHGVNVLPPSYGIAQEVIEEIKARRPIEDEVGLLTDLRRSGNSHRGVCPVCPGGSNRTSLAVWSDRQSWHCFRCALGGDLIDWVMAVQRWEFPAAVQHLADVTGVDLPKPSRPSRLRTRRLT